MGTPCPATMGTYLATIILLTDTPAMFVRYGWMTRLLIWRGREMELASTAGFLRLRFRDSSSALLHGKLHQPHWLIFLVLRERQRIFTETLTQKQIKPMPMLSHPMPSRLMPMLSHLMLNKRMAMLIPTLHKQMAMQIPKLSKLMELILMILPLSRLLRTHIPMTMQHLYQTIQMVMLRKHLQTLFKILRQLPINQSINYIILIIFIKN